MPRHNIPSHGEVGRFIHHKLEVSYKGLGWQPLLMITLSSKGSLHQTNDRTAYVSHKTLTNYEGISGMHCSSVLHIKDIWDEMPGLWV